MFSPGKSSEPLSPGQRSLSIIQVMKRYGIASPSHTQNKDQLSPVVARDLSPEREWRSPQGDNTGHGAAVTVSERHPPRPWHTSCHVESGLHETPWKRQPVLPMPPVTRPPTTGCR